MFLVSKVSSSFYAFSNKVLNVCTLMILDIAKPVFLAITILYYTLSWQHSLLSQTHTYAIKLRELATKIHINLDLELQMMKAPALAVPV